MEFDCAHENGNYSMYSWGNSSEGQTGLGSVQDTFVKVPTSLTVTGVINVKQIACGELHTLLLADNGRVYSCGNNDYGQLGHDKSRFRFQEIDVLRTQNIVAIACGEHHSIAVTEWGHIFAWGNCDHGQLGLNCEEETSQSVPKLVKSLATKQIVQACCGYQHCMALTADGELYSWGSNEYGQLGLGNNNQVCYPAPQEIKLLSSLPIAYIACGGYHSFALSKSGAVYGWGKNTQGQLGIGDQFNKNSPSHLVTLRNICVKYIDCGEEFSVFLTLDGGVFSCGAGSYGQLGHGSLSGLLIPKKIMDLMGNTVTQVSCGRRHTLAFIPSIGKVYAFGVGKSGQLGINSTTNSSTPQVVKGPWLLSERESTASSAAADEYVVRRVYSGGNYCFVTVCKKKDNMEIEDCRYLPCNTQILTVDLTKLKQCAPLEPFDSIDADLLTYVETVMGSLSCLNGSFLKENEHYGCSSRNSGLDIEYLTECFQVISTFKHPSLQQVIMAGIGNVIANIPSNLIDMEMKRIFIILPLYHDFTDSKHYDWLHMPFGERYLMAFDDIDEWLENINEEYFARVIIIFKVLFLDQLRVIVPSYDRKWTREYTVPLNILSKLHRINERGWNGSEKYSGHKVPYSLFQIPELNDKVDIRQDYVRWYTENDTMKDNYFCNYSFLFDAQAKTTVLLTDQAMQMQGAMQEAASRAFSRIFFSPVLYSDDIAQFLDINIRRSSLVMDTIQELDKRQINEFKKPLRVHFIGEEAEDAGGVRKEFFMLVFREILDPKYGMFKEYDDNALWFREDTFEEAEMFTMIGILCGLAIYNFTIINLPFPLALYKKLLQEPIRYQDIKGLSPALYRSFEDLLNYTDDDIEDVFDLRFEITKDVFGEIKVVPLLPDGENIRVNNNNKKQFVELYVDMVLNKSVERTFTPFYQGFHRVCGGRVLQLFQAHELMSVVVGNEDYDWKQLENNTEYKGGYTENDETIKMFWDVFHNSLSLEDKKKFLLYLTGTDRIPIQGMKAIRIIIQPTNDDKFLPVAHTCFNLLDLPRYKTKERLKYKLLQAIQQTEGFSLV